MKLPDYLILKKIIPCKIFLTRMFIALRIVIMHKKGGFFDREWYLQKYPDVKARGMNPLIHFSRHGVFENRQPNEEFDSGYYLQNNHDVAGYGRSPLIHFMLHGYKENRLWRNKADSVASNPQFIDRQSFFGMVDQTTSILEIGKLCFPIFPESKNLDVFTREELVFKYRNDPSVDPDKIVDVDFLIRNNDWSVIHEKFDSLITSHFIEHVPCLIGFFRNAGHVLKEKGRIYAAIPDYRYCFDVDKMPSTILDVIEAKYLNRKKPGIREVLETMLVRSPIMDPAIHWQKGEYQLTADKYFEIEPARLKKVLAKDFSVYRDAHCWKFTPPNFKYIVETLWEIGEIDFRVERIFHTRHNTLEFYVILKREQKKESASN